jgi:hypothetical protein
MSDLRSEQHERNVRDLAHTFNRGVNLLERYFAAYADDPNFTGFPTRPDRDLRDSLLKRLEIHFLLSKGYFERHAYLAQVGAGEAAEDNQRLATRSQTWALIYASAARKANRDQAGTVLSRRVEHKILHTRDQIRHAPSQKEFIEELQAHIDVAESRGWQRADGDTRLVAFIGATWCPDTANVVEIMGSFGLPMHMLIMDEESRNEDGLYQYNDHALLAIKLTPQTDRLRIPVVFFPNGDRFIEPKPGEFMIELVRHKIL